MARVQFVSPVEEIRGSIAGNTYSRNTSGPILRARRVPTSTTSSSQVASLNALNNLQNQWRLLDYATVVAWDEWSKGRTRVNIFGKLTKLSGQQWFLSINTNRILLGEIILTTPPYPYGPITPTAAWITPTTDVLSIDIFPPFPMDGYPCCLYTTPPNFSTNKIVQSLFRFTGLLFHGAAEPWDITQLWCDTHDLAWPPSIPCRFNLQYLLYAISIDSGIQSPSTLLSNQVSFT